MDSESLRLALQLTNMIGTFCIGVWMYLEKRSDKSNERVAELYVKVEQIDLDVSAIKVSLKTSPSHADLAKLYDSINALAGTVNQLVGENRGQTDTLRLILNQITQKGLK